MAKVLVVDDEFSIADLLVDVLSDEGHNVLTASDGRQGLEALSKERPDLVFLDYMMPVMDGAGLLRGVADDPSLQSIPIVMMSSVPEEAVIERCAGYVFFMRKPFRILEVLALAERFLTKR